MRRYCTWTAQSCHITNAPPTNPPSDIQAYCAEFTELDTMTEDQVKNLIHSSCLKKCSLDPLPAPIMNGCVGMLLPVLTKMIIMSIETATVPVQLREAMIRPKLKKESLDHEVYANIRPISNLRFISKIIEKALKLNREKTELLVRGPKNKITPPIEGIHEAGKYIEAVSSNARNI